MSLSPKIILADEPTGNLDSVNANIVYDTLNTLNSLGKTVILVTHSTHCGCNAKKVLHIHNRGII